MELRRKAYDELLRWKENDHGESAILVSGARRTGKSYIVEMFAKREFRSYVLIDFAKASDEIKESFVHDGNNLDLLFTKISLEYNVRLHPRESAIILDEVQLFPRARELIKALVADGRYYFIETGSLLSIKFTKKNILIPSEETELVLNPMDFEEFLWAMGEDRTVDILRGFYDGRKPVGEAVHRRMMDLFRSYMVVGGMPQAVVAFLKNKDYAEVESTKRRILKLYREDISKYTDTAKESQRVREIFDTIPMQLNKKGRTFKESVLETSTRSRGYDESFMWLDDARVTNFCYNATDPSAGLAMYMDDSRMKLYMADTGLLITHAMSELRMDANAVCRELIMGCLNLNEGMFAENAVAQALVATGHRLYYYSRSDPETRRNSVEVDFLIMDDGKVRALEVKSGRSTKHVSLDKFEARFGKRTGQPCILCTRDLEERGGILYLPLYMAMFL